MSRTKPVSIKIPTQLLDEMPAPGNGRSAFIVGAIEEKIARRQKVDWKPKSERGRRMASLLDKGLMERTPPLTEVQIEKELSERRGRRF